MSVYPIRNRTDHGEHETAPRFWGSRYAVGLLVLGAIAGYFLLTEHRAHFFGALPFLLLLACPLMHVFMHHGHGTHDHHHGPSEPQAGLDKPNPVKPGEPS